MEKVERRVNEIWSVQSRRCDPRGDVFVSCTCGVNAAVGLNPSSRSPSGLRRSCETEESQHCARLSHSLVQWTPPDGTACAPDPPFVGPGPKLYVGSNGS